MFGSLSSLACCAFLLAATTTGTVSSGSSSWSALLGQQQQSRGLRSSIFGQQANQPRAMAESCEFGCEDVPCDRYCESAFAYCPYTDPLCFSEELDTWKFGWSNPVDCEGGSFECELWIGCGRFCNRHSRTSLQIGTVHVDTDYGTVNYTITDPWYTIESVQVYVGSTFVPLIDGEYDCDPNNYTYEAWYYPNVKYSILNLEKEILPNDYLIAHANVCPKKESVMPSAAPSIFQTPAPAPTDEPVPECPVPSMEWCYDTPSPTYMPSTAPPSQAIETASPTLAINGTNEPTASPDKGGYDRNLMSGHMAECPFECTNAELPCDASCTSAFAYCNYTEMAMCFANETSADSTVSWGWSNPIGCNGGGIECELWVGADGCNIESESAMLIGSVFIDTDYNTVSYYVTDPDYRVSSAQVYLGHTWIPMLEDGTYTVNPQDYTQQVWYDPNTRNATVRLDEDIDGGKYLIAHANVCPYDLDTDAPSEVPSMAPSVSISPTEAPTTTPPSCPIPTHYPCVDTPAPSLFIGTPAPSSGVGTPSPSLAVDTPSPSLAVDTPSPSLDTPSPTLPTDETPEPTAETPEPTA